MPVYNGQKFVGEAIGSILNQTYKNFEFIIIDDGSTDNTLNIIHEFEDDRILLIKNNTNLGIAKSLNIGIDTARGKYIARMDADDISKRIRFARQYAILEKYDDINLVADNPIYCKGKKRIFTKQSAAVELLFHNCVKHSSVMMRRYVNRRLVK